MISFINNIFRSYFLSLHFSDHFKLETSALDHIEKTRLNFYPFGLANMNFFRVA